VTVHLVEPGGRGGVYQHTVALATSLAESGVDVHLHTAADPEPLPTSVALPSHPCLWRLSWLRPRWLRQLAVAAGWLVGGIPTCVRRVRHGDDVHIQGWFRPGLLLPLVAAVRLRRCTVAWSPHTTFSRRGRLVEERLARWMARHVDAVHVFSEWDRRRVEAWGARAERTPFAFVVPAAEPWAVAAWRERWLGDRADHVALFAGQIRPDKGLDTLVRAAALWGERAVLAVVGEDVGAAPQARRLAAELGVRVVWDEGYCSMEAFTAAVAAADVVVCPYRRASQSGVLAVAGALGRPTVASSVGGLAELADTVVPPDDPQALAEAILRTLDATLVADVGVPS
jgi:glycosyltransferase involved in cell wall biosynthesis